MSKPSQTHRCCNQDCATDPPPPECLGTFEADQPDTFCGAPICPPCYASLRTLLADLKAKGITVEATFDFGGAA